METSVREALLPKAETPRQTVKLSMKSSADGNTTMTNHSNWLSFMNPFKHGSSEDASKIKDLVPYKAKIAITRKNIGGLNIRDPISDLVGLGQELIGNHVKVQLVSNEVDPATKEGKVSGEVTVEHWLKPWELFTPCIFEFELDFHVPRDFGVPGAIIVTNGHKNLVLMITKTAITTEFKLEKAQVTLQNDTVVHFVCNSWVFASETGKEGRVFFANKEYTPAQTPPGLKTLRTNELAALRGPGTGERKVGERIYDYDVYNDLGTEDNKRHILGGKNNPEFPYPRRCRTGKKLLGDNKTETRSDGLLATTYIPFDEYFNPVKKGGFFRAAFDAEIQSLTMSKADPEKAFTKMEDVFKMYVPVGDHTKMEKATKHQPQPFELIHRLPAESGDNKNIKYPTPKILADNTDGWWRDEEFARQTVAGLNPLLIEAVQKFPLEGHTAMTEEMLQRHLDSLAGHEAVVTVSEAVSNKRLFVLDYHERLLPYIQRINDEKFSQAYASRTLFFLTHTGILMPVLIELALPTSTEVPKFRVFEYPGPMWRVMDGTKLWPWRLAKAHVRSNDACWHQVVSHWLRTHACIEPFIIATNRQLSVMHPVNKALHPHFKNTMDINQLARKSLINAGGLVESNFTPGKYSIEMSAVAYRSWRFVDQGLPNDLIKRGMAVPDASAPHGLKLLIEDYPYANDGLELWDAIRAWVKDHIDVFYFDDAAVLADPELQEWWKDARTKGHADIEDGWIPTDSKDHLVQIITTIIWVASCHHAAVNFGQYMYAGFMPNSPSLTTKLIPEEGSSEWNTMLFGADDTESWFLSMLANPVQTRINMTTIEILSTHSTEEDYLGQRGDDWSSNPEVLAAFEKFTENVLRIDALITERNNIKLHPELKNRTGLVKAPYELLRPRSEPGLTNMGIPNSVSI